MKRHNPIPCPWGTTYIKFIDQDSPNENLDGEDLRNANLKGSNLSGSSFRNANLEGAVLYGCDLRNCDFTGANLDGASLAFARVEGAIFDGCSLNYTMLCDPMKILEIDGFDIGLLDSVGGFVVEREGRPELEKSLAHIILSQYLDGGDYTKVQFLELFNALSGCFDLMDEDPIDTIIAEHGVYCVYRYENFAGMYLTQVTDETYQESQRNSPAILTEEYVLEYEKYSGFSLENIDLRGADFRYATIRSALFKECDLKNSSFHGAKLAVMFDNCNLEDADFSEAKLYMDGGHTIFNFSQMQRAKFCSTQLNLNHFAQCNLTNADFRGSHIGRLVSFMGSNLRGADLRQIDTEENLARVFGGADYDDSTRFDIGTASEVTKYMAKYNPDL